MNKYETVFIINPNVEDAGVKELTQKFSDIINNDGKVESEGIYVLINFEAAPGLIAELERVYRITDEVMKFIVVRKDEE